MSSRKWCKKCFAPGCSSNSSNEPLKAFIKLPPGSDIRRKWAEAVGRKGKEVYFNAVSSVYCCGDHFNLEEDAANWMKYRMMGGRIKLKAGILPKIVKKIDNKDPLLPDGSCGAGRKIDGRNDRLLSDNEQSSNTDEHNIDLKEELFSNIVKSEPTESVVEETYFQAVPDIKSEPFLDCLENDVEDPFLDVSSRDNTRSSDRSFSHKDIQCNINIRKHVRSKATQVNINLLTCSRGTSPIIFKEEK